MKKYETIYSIMVGAGLSLLMLMTVVGCYFSDGRDGRDGVQGLPGIQGESCTTEQLENGALIKCGSATSVIVNGSDGLQGPQGPQGEPGQNLSPGAYNVVATIDPCGKQGSYDELLLKLQNGQILAHYSHGNKQFLTVVGEGSYVTTDGTNCQFQVDSNLNVTW